MDTVEIRNRLARLQKRRLPADRVRKAAVLLAFRYLEGAPHFLLTRRSQRVATHKGQISFPGGLREPLDEDLVDTALRETREEIGVPKELVHILGSFHEYRAVTDVVVRPIVAEVEGKPNFRLQEAEVDYVLDVPFAFFRESSPRIERRKHAGVWHRVYYFDYEGEVIWGLTARIIRDFLAELG